MNTAICRNEVTKMEEGHRFQVVAWWTSGRAGIAKSGSSPNAIHFTSPQAFGGLEGRWAPEELLLCALASCYTTTFFTLAEASKFEYEDLGVEVEGTIEKFESGYGFTEISIRPTLMIPMEHDQVRAWRLLEKTKGLCLVSRALSIPQRFELRVQVRESLPKKEQRQTV
jgi:organic hydroperoxide reductase OsmC/OhrA